MKINYKTNSKLINSNKAEYGKLYKIVEPINNSCVGNVGSLVTKKDSTGCLRILLHPIYVRECGVDLSLDYALEELQSGTKIEFTV